MNNNEVLNLFLIKYNIKNNFSIKQNNYNINDNIFVGYKIKHNKNIYYVNKYLERYIYLYNIYNEKNIMNNKINYIIINNRTVHFDNNNNLFAIKKNKLINNIEYDIYNFKFNYKNIEIRYYYSNLLSDGCTYTINYKINCINNFLYYFKNIACEWCIGFIIEIYFNKYIFNYKILI